MNLNINYEQFGQSHIDSVNWIDYSYNVARPYVFEMCSSVHRWLIEWNKHQTIGNSIRNWSEQCSHSTCNWRHIKYEWDSPQFTPLIETTQIIHISLQIHCISHHVTHKYRWFSIHKCFSSILGSWSKMCLMTTMCVKFVVYPLSKRILFCAVTPR